MSETNQVPQSQLPSDISFQVMPHAKPNMGAPLPTPPVQTHGGGSGSKTAYIIIAVVVLLLLAGLAYYFLGGKEPTQQQNTNSRLGRDFLQTYFAKDVCDDETSCGENADPDKDGLTNYEEFVKGTSPTSADGDGDGLADGDEVNIYGTNPKEKYTDDRAIAKQQDYNDGASIRNGYDPTTPGSKYTETALTAIQNKIMQFQLHAPTTTTLGLNFDGTKANPTQ